MGEVFEVELFAKGAKLPNRANGSEDAGMDLFSLLDVKILPWEDHLFPLGFRCKLPDNHVMIVFEKSGRAVKQKLDVGAKIIDPGYRGEVHVHLFNNSDHPVYIRRGEAIAQALILPCWLGFPTKVKSLDIDTSRGEGGFGSTPLKGT